MPISDQTLHVKSFFAASIPEAIESARQELGPNALLLQTREAPPEARYLGDFEVVFGCAPQTSNNAPVPAAAPSTGFDDLRQRMDEMQNLLSRIVPACTGAGYREGLIEQALLKAAVDPELARDIAESVPYRRKPAVREIAAPRAAAEIEKYSLAADVAAEIEKRFDVRPELGRIAAVVGPPGSGKTTTLVKLAVKEGLSAGRRVRLISADTQRVGGAAQLHAFASILGVAFQAVESTAELAQAVKAAGDDTLLLIDTPGYSINGLEEMGGELVRFLAGCQEIDTHLVLTASMRPSSLRNVAAAYARFQPQKLLFTHLDETSSYAPVFCEAVRQARPVSFVCSGQEIPQDIAPADKQNIIASLVRQLPESLEAVA